jgi:hypothetical protein
MVKELYAFQEKCKAVHNGESWFCRNAYQ